MNLRQISENLNNLVIAIKVENLNLQEQILFTFITVTLSFRNKNREPAEENEINQTEVQGPPGHVYENNVQMEPFNEPNVYNSLQTDQNVDHVYECMKNSKQ